MTAEESYQLALKVAIAGKEGRPMPEVPEDCRKVCERLWNQARKWARIK